MEIQTLSLNNINGFIIRYQDSKKFTKALLRFSEFTCKKQFRKMFLIEDYLKEQNIAPESMLIIAQAIMVLDFYLTDLVEHYTEDNLYEEEKELIEYLKKEGCFGGDHKYFVIGLNTPIIKDEESILNHEMSHVLYRTNEEYRKKADSIFDNLDDDLNDLARYILMGHYRYKEEELKNEFQAHLFGGFNEFQVRHFDVDISELRRFFPRRYFFY